MKEPNFNLLVGLMTSQWEEVKSAINKNPNSFYKLIETSDFFNHFKQVVENTKETHEIKLSDLGMLLRGVKEKVALDDYGRMIPLEEYSETHNRMNPKGKAYVYISTSKEDSVMERAIEKNQVTKTVIKELRAVGKDYISICELEISKEFLNERIFDLCGDPSIPTSNTDLGNYLTKKLNECTNPEEIKGKLSEVLSKIYFQMFSSDEIFKPVNSNEEATRYYEYGPFHLLASYFEKQGYVGLMYRSTVCSTGINIVLFNNRLVEVKHGSIENVQVNTFDLK